MKKEIPYIYLLLTTSVLLFGSGCAILETSYTAPPHFRQVWWGNTKASVLTKEQGKRIHTNAGGSLVYKTRYGNTPILLVYCFRSQNGIYRLRAAGYMTATPAATDNPDSVFRQELLETLGDPTETLADGGMMWLGDETVVYTNAYRAGGGRNGFFTRSRPGSIIPIPRRGHVQGWHLITGYIDRNFYNDILNAETWNAIHSDLSYYEEIFFGMFRKVPTPRFKVSTKKLVELSTRAADAERNGNELFQAIIQLDSW